MFTDNEDDNLEIVVFIHDSIIDASGGSKGFHDERLVRSALGRPLQTSFGKDMYKTDFDKAAALLLSLALNHGFTDGNKRTAMACAVIFLRLKNINIEFSNKEYEDFMVYVVTSKPCVGEVAQWLEDRIRIEK